MSMLSPDSIRLYIQDAVEDNRLIEGLEFTDDQINHYLEVAIGDFNTLPPVSAYKLSNLPQNMRTLILYFALAHMFKGRAAMAARNQMSYSDAGLTIPIEERYQYYRDMAGNFMEMANRRSAQFKASTNLDSDQAWGSVGSDYSHFPVW